MHWEHYTLVQPNEWRWRYFSPKELASNGDGSLLVHEASLDMLEALRESIRKPLYINSAYRDPIYNAKIGGAPKSMHKTGKAFDISLRNHVKEDLIAHAKAVGFTGIGKNYATFVHVDTGRKREW